ncbi:MAG TPA: pseudouridine synthase [Bryobacteraceae bacterium]|jgi:pseudouridine synthase|nr:pseudouridine synthase [Bryobacteraceae bacterium]
MPEKQSRPSRKRNGKQLKTLDRALSKAGLGSRTEARSWIGAGRVQVNGRVIQTPDHWVDLAHDRISFDGKSVRSGARLYLLLNKPKGYITTYKDPEGRATVFDLIPDSVPYVFPVGRLDRDTSGLLLLTNDTQFAERITNPEFKVEKTYLVKASGYLPDDLLQKLREGVELNDGPTQPARVKRVRDSGKYTFLEISIREGRNRQVRRMIEAVGSRVLKLVRTSIGTIEIAGLEIGKYRELSAIEVRGLLGKRT